MPKPSPSATAYSSPHRAEAGDVRRPTPVMAGAGGRPAALAHLLFGPAELRGGVGLELLELVRGGAPGRLEVTCVPAGEAGTGLVRALAEREQCRLGVACGAHRLVGEDRQ